MHKILKILLPLVIILIIGIIVISYFFWRPSMIVKEKFLYAIVPLEDLPICQGRIDSIFYHSRLPYVEMGEVTYNGRRITCEYPLFIYDAETDTSKSISTADAKKLQLAKYIDNFTIAQSCEKNAKWKVDTRSNQTIYPCIMNNNYEFKYLNIPYQANGPNYFFFIGWIK